jgi:hypothetical protein
MFRRIIKIVEALYSIAETLHSIDRSLESRRQLLIGIKRVPQQPPTRDPGSRFTPGASRSVPRAICHYLAVGPRGADLERSTLRIEKRRASG